MFIGEREIILDPRGRDTGFGWMAWAVPHDSTVFRTDTGRTLPEEIVAWCTEQFGPGHRILIPLTSEKFEVRGRHDEFIGRPWYQINDKILIPNRDHALAFRLRWC